MRLERENGFWISIIFIALLSAILHLEGFEGIDSLLLLLMVAMVSAYTIFDAFLHNRLEIEHIIYLLMVAVGLLTYLTNLHLEGTLLLGMFGLAEMLEHVAMERAESSLKRLMEYMPRVARVRRGSTFVEVGFDSIEKGDLVIVARGERVPVDGLVIRGKRHLDQSVVTGDPFPISVGKDNYVYSGSLLLDGSLVVKALRVGKETFVSRMLGLVEEFKERKSASERLVQRFSKFYLPAMLLLSLISWLFLGVNAAIVLVAVACPSAFLVAAPSTTLISLAIAARRGVLFKGSVSLERASSIDVAAIDKTGTVTLGRLVVKEVGMSMEDFRLLASLELASQHPIAKAIVEDARNRGMKLTIPEGVREVPGQGIRGLVEGIEVMAGKASFVGGGDDGRGVGIVVHARIGDRYSGRILLGDQVDPSAKRVIDGLREMGIRIVMLTGDREDNALPIARFLEVDELHAGLKPEDKVRVVEKLKEGGDRVAMVGDGINDAPALDASDPGVAVGGLEASIEAGDVALVSGFRYLTWLFKAAKRTISGFWANMLLVGGSKALAANLGIMGAIPLWAAVALGDDGGLLLVLLNLWFIARDLMRLEIASP